MSSLVLDTGALIAVERFDRSVWALLAEARERGTEVVIPATVLAQAWRGGPHAAPIAKLLEASRLDPLYEERAKEIGVRLGIQDASDVVDAHVVCCAAGCKAAVATSDLDDIERLTDPADKLVLIRV